MKAMAWLGALLLVPSALANVEPYIAARHGAKCDLEIDGALTCRYRIGASSRRCPR